MTTYYIRDRRHGAIVDAVTTDRAIDDAVHVLASMTGAEHLYLDANPPLHILKQYRYWDERP
jgi:hypothetical protein